MMSRVKGTCVSVIRHRVVDEVETFRRRGRVRIYLNMVAILASSTSTIVVDPVVVVCRVSSDPQVLDGVRNLREIRVRSGLDSRTEKTQEKNRGRIHLEEKHSTQATGVARDRDRLEGKEPLSQEHTNLSSAPGVTTAPTPRIKLICHYALCIPAKAQMVAIAVQPFGTVSKA
jgi:hypothetical protein